jgi:formate hydrogenlyase subunit 3/multisubunit Na+/H+ antiporter MnhD subunit
MRFEIILVLGTLITVVGLVIVLLIRRRRPRIKKEVDYRALFNMGIIFLGAGLAMSAATHIINPLFMLGLVYFIMGLANKDKWKTSGK